jgi:hypothetical protein
MTLRDLLPRGGYAQKYCDNRDCDCDCDDDTQKSLKNASARAASFGNCRNRLRTSNVRWHCRQAAQPHA